MMNLIRFEAVRSVLLSGVLLAVAIPAHAQRMPELNTVSEVEDTRAKSPSLSPDTREESPPAIAPVILASVFGTAAGGVAGLYLGYRLDNDYFHWGCSPACDESGEWGAVAGWFLGSAVVTPLAAHLANDHRGSLEAAYLASTLIAGLGFAATAALNSPEAGFIVFGAPLAQVVSAVLIETLTGE